MQLYRPFYSQTFPKFKLFLCKNADCDEEVISFLQISFSKVLGNVSKEIGLPLQTQDFTPFYEMLLMLTICPLIYENYLMTALCILLKTHKSEEFKMAEVT